jgi:hypothetical protein
MGKVVKITDGAFFVRSYSTQTILPAYDTALTMQTLSPSDAIDDDDDLELAVDETTPRIAAE